MEDQALKQLGPVFHARCWDTLIFALFVSYYAFKNISYYLYRTTYLVKLTHVSVFQSKHFFLLCTEDRIYKRKPGLPCSRLELD